MKTLLLCLTKIPMIALFVLPIILKPAWSLEVTPQNFARSRALLDIVIDRCGAIVVLDEQKLFEVRNTWQSLLAGNDGRKLRESYSTNKANHEQIIKEHPSALVAMCATTAIMIKIELNKKNPIISVTTSRGIDILQ